YVPYEQSAYPLFTLILKTAGDPAALSRAAEGAVKEVDHDQPVSSIRTMDDILDESFAGRRFSMSLFVLFATLALVLVAVGIYGVVSFAVTLRMHEIGVRVALGARPLDIARLVLAEGLRLAVVGVGVGLVVALALSRFIVGMLYGVSPTDPF